ncbi:hypothetical protein [Bradyrhizobium brasilense]|uniref:hypothetical protein n=1 Tax=Bradyrhizobium brasilense TaxID=1419277 RepID=UPI001E559AB8|nr:hypothetical protein [Bradyrhizobium brasilense]MCC8976979.1 hypothetical protein [Bradyrhizobium brasilense]
MQVELFEQALADLEADADLVNQVLEVTAEEEDQRVLRYALPRDLTRCGAAFGRGRVRQCAGCLGPSEARREIRRAAP